MYTDSLTVREGDRRTDLETLFDGSRLVLEYDLVDQDNLVKLVWQESFAHYEMMSEEEGPPPPPSGTGESGPAGSGDIGQWNLQASYSNLQFAGVGYTSTNGVVAVGIGIPNDFTNRVSLIACTNLLDPTVSNAFASLPYTEDFESMDEGALHEQDDWICAPTNSVVIQTNEVNGGSQAAEFLMSTNTPTADQFIAAQGETNVWIDFRAKIDPRAVTYFDDHPDIDDAPAYEPCVFAVNRRGEVWAYDGTQEAWTNDARFILTEYQWHRFTVRENYNDHTWDLFIDSIRVFAGLGFRQWLDPYVSIEKDIQEFSRFTVAAARGGGWYVDDISVGTTQPEELCGELQTTNIRVSVSSSDDADEQDDTGEMSLDRGKLQLANDIVGLRIVFIFTDTGNTKEREARSSEDGADLAPLLHVEWGEPLP